MQNKKSIDIYLITGFLGSGKTTLIKNLIKDNPGFKVGVVVNEFGQVGIDGSLIKEDGIDLFEINNGSIFCSCLQTTFSKALVELSRLSVDLLLIESSGVSDPSNMEAILESIKSSAYAELKYKGSICLVDATNIMKLIQVSQAVERQVLYGDYIIINKTDLVSETIVNDIEKLIREINPYAVTKKAEYANVQDILSDITFIENKNASSKESCNTPSSRPPVIYIKSKDDFDKKRFKEFVNAIQDKAFRTKGFFLLDGFWHHIDGVNQELIIKPVNISRDFSELIIFPNTDERAIQDIQKICSTHMPDGTGIFIKTFVKS